MISNKPGNSLFLSNFSHSLQPRQAGEPVLARDPAPQVEAVGDGARHEVVARTSRDGEELEPGNADRENQAEVRSPVRHRRQRETSGTG